MPEINDQTKNEEVVITAPPNPFDETSWIEKQPEATKEVADVESGTTDKTEEKQQQESSEDIVDADVWVKENFGWENIESGKKDLEELRKLKESGQTPAEIKFANEQSQKLFEAIKEGKEDDVFSFLHKKRELSQVEIMKAEEVIRLNIKYANPHFKDADVLDVFEEQYAKPVKPVQGEDELDTDYSIRLQAWENQIEKIGRKIERDSITAKQELSKYNAELVLPDLPKKEVPIQEQDNTIALEQFKAYRTAQFERIDSEGKSFSGFSVKYKDEEVEIPITYSVPDEERSSLIQTMKNEVLGETFNVNDYFAKRWVGENGNFNVNQMMADIYLLNNPEKVFQKFANESATKRLEHKMKTASNIVVNGNSSQGTFNPDARTEVQKLGDFFWNQ